MRALSSTLAAVTLAGLATACASQEAGTEIALETVAEITETRPDNIAVTPDGRVILTNHPLDETVKPFHIVRLTLPWSGR